MKRVAILGAGGLGTAIVVLFGRTVPSVSLWARDPSRAAELARTRENARHLAGALKNILGIAAGICDGLGFGDNAKAALLTRGLVEIARFAVDQGAQFSTFTGLAGVGDVVTTCYSPFGRNRAVGLKIGRGAT